MCLTRPDSVALLASSGDQMPLLMCALQGSGDVHCSSDIKHLATTAHLGVLSLQLGILLIQLGLKLS